MAGNAHGATSSVLDASSGAPPPGCAHREHILRLYEDDKTLHKTVADFVGDGLAKGEPCLLVATQEHLSGISGELRVRGLDCDLLEKNRRLLRVDAQETLRQIAPGAELDREFCLHILNDLISRLAGAGDGTIVVYGEMVDLLCQSGRPQTAVLLEQIWNELLRQRPVHLLCGYAARMFGTEDQPLLDVVCSEHSLCLPSGAYLASDERTRLRQVLFLEQRARELEAEVERRRSATAELARFNRAAVGRELRIIELKNEVNELRLRLGEDPKYLGTDEPARSDSRQPLPLQETGPALAPLESILRTEELSLRPRRPPQYEAEHRALLSLIQRVADSPQNILQELADKALELLNADSAGLSLLNDAGDGFYWAAIAGMWKPHVGGVTPRHFGPCGDVLDCRKPLLFSRWDRRYPYLSDATPLAEEGLLVPFFVQGRAVGTIWAIAHNPNRKFDTEDSRLLESLGQFASAAYQALQNFKALEQRQAALSLLEDSRRMQQKVQEQAQLLDLTQDAVLSLKWDGVIEFWNRGAEERYGWAAGEALGQVAHDLLHTEFPEPLSDIKERLVRDGYWQGELVHYKRDGMRIDVASRWALRRDLDGRPCGFLEITTDITERKKAEEQLRQSQRLESLGVLAGGIAHDFNNLLQGILGNAWFALEVLGQQTPAKPMLEEVVAASERAAGLTRQMLAYAGKEEISTRPVDLSILVREITGLLRASIPKNVHLSLDVPIGLPYVEADSTQLQQVIMNLIINAAEAISDGAPGTVTARTAYRKPTAAEQAGAIIPLDSVNRPYLTLTITDTGTGIAPEIRSRIFDPFYTTKFMGRGLGLSAVLGIIKAHRGSIALQTTSGSGTTFTVFLPVSHEVAQPEIATAAPCVRPAETVLVVDDELTVRSVAERVLRHAGYEVVLAENGREAIDILAARPEIGAVILDLAMPVMSGEQALPQLLRLRPALPIILSSGYSEAEARRHCKTAGVTAFIQKPYKSPTLINTLAACLHGNDEASLA
jgi:PAS domain S-box-containing protein